MSKTKEQKKVIVQSLSKQFDKASSVVFSSFERVTVRDIEKLRKAFREKGVSYTIVKKSLLARVLEDKGVSSLSLDALRGNIALAFGMEDAVAPATLLTDFQKEHETMRILGGVLERVFLNVRSVVALAHLPSKEQLRTQLVYTMNAPVAGLLHTLAGNIRNLVTVLYAIRDKAS